jgi:hypothetical protein
MPPEASERVAALTRTDGDSTAPTAGALVSANAPKGGPSETKSAEPATSVASTQPKAAKAPEGAALSTDVDYSSYVPGVGFVGKTEAGTTSTAPQAAPAPIDTPAQPVVMAPQQPAQTGTQPAQPASPTAPQAAQPAQPAQTAPAVQAAATGPSLAATGTQDAAPAPETDLAQRFTIVERSVQVLRRKYTAGSISRDQLQAELRKLMILDEDGQWWMIGLESDRWYKYSGKDWTPATPPGRRSSGATGLLPPLDESAPSRTGTSGFNIPLDE